MKLEWPRGWAIAVLGILGLAQGGVIAPALALDPDKPFAQYAHDRWTISQGLPFPGGSEIAQDSEGYLWLGSLAGLARLDGARITTYDTGNTPELGGNIIYGLQTDPQGRLWIGTELGVTVYDRGVFTAVPDLRGRSVRVLGEDEGLMLVSDGNAVTGYDAGLQRQRSYELPRVNAFGRIGRDLWFSTDHLLYRVRDGQPHPVSLPGLGEGFAELFLRVGDRLYVASTAGLHYLEDDMWVAHPDPRLRKRVLSMLADRDHNLWVGMESSLLRLRGGRVVEEIDLEGFAPAPRRLFEDRKGSLWIGTHVSGLHRFWNGVADFTPLHLPQEDAQYIWALAHWQGETFAAGSFGMAVRRGGRLHTVPGSEKLPMVYSLAPDGDALLVGTVRGVHLYHRDGQLVAPPALAPLADTRTNAFLRDRDGRLWLGTSRGLYRLDADGRLRRITGSDNSTHQEIRLIRQLRDGRIIAAGEGQLFQIDGDTPRALPLPRERLLILALHETPQGRLLLGSKSGASLYLQRDGGWLALGPEHGVPVNEAYAIIPDDRGNLLVSGLRGAYLFPEHDLERVAADPGASLGIQGLLTLNRHYSPGQEVVCCLGGGDGRGFFADGRFELPISQGIYSVQPPPPTPANSSVRIERLSTHEQPNVPVHDGVASGPLPAGERDVSFDFSVASLMPLHLPRLRYRLHGYDSDWRALPLLAQPTVQYTNLPAGDYRFEVFDSASTATSPPASLSFSIAPHLHETAWFKVLMVLSAIVSLVLLVRFNDRRHRRQRVLLEQEVAARTRDLLHANERLELISHTDVLTGLHNRRRLAEDVPRRLQRLRHAAPDALPRKVVLFALLDIDHFKRINDSFGHHSGDAVLQEVARRLAAQTRGGDSLARWGGEEFLLVCFDIAREQAAGIAERLCECIRARPVIVDGRPLDITISVGVVLVQASNAELLEDWEQVVRTADRALYMAKHAGRDGWRALDAETAASATTAHHHGGPTP